MRSIAAALLCLALTAAVADEKAAPVPASSQPAPTAQQPAADDAEVKRLQARGYRMEVHEGHPVYCRHEEVLGSRLGGHKVWRTAQQIQIQEEETRSNVQRTQHNGPNKPVG